jgi:hypothetical protein
MQVAGKAEEPSTANDSRHKVTFGPIDPELQMNMKVATMRAGVPLFQWVSMNFEAQIELDENHSRMSN